MEKNLTIAQVYTGVSYCQSGKRSSAAVDTSLKQLIIHSSAVATVANTIFGIVWGKKDSKSALCH